MQFKNTCKIRTALFQTPKHFPYRGSGALLDDPPQKLTDSMISNQPEKGLYMEDFSRSLRISRAKQGLRGILALLMSGLHGLIDFLISDYMA